jgi:hypothetical protein
MQCKPCATNAFFRFSPQCVSRVRFPSWLNPPGLPPFSDVRLVARPENRANVCTKFAKKGDHQEYATVSTVNDRNFFAVVSALLFTVIIMDEDKIVNRLHISFPVILRFYPGLPLLSLPNAPIMAFFRPLFVLCTVHFADPSTPFFNNCCESLHFSGFPVPLLVSFVW